MSIRLIHRFIITLKKLKERFTNQDVPFSYIHHKVPYFSQFESRELVQDFLSGKLEAKDDPDWKNSGASTREEYSDWAWSGCGMACLKMILAHTTHQTIPLVTLGKQCLAYGGYRLPLDKHPGLYYQPFSQFVKQEYQLKAKVSSSLTVYEITIALSSHGYVIASVNPAIRDPQSTPKNRSGHLVLIIGYDNKKKLLYLHNPSGTKPKNQEYVEISYKDFQKFFGNQGIALFRP